MCSSFVIFENFIKMLLKCNRYGLFELKWEVSISILMPPTPESIIDFDIWFNVPNNLSKPWWLAGWLKANYSVSNQFCSEAQMNTSTQLCGKVLYFLISVKSREEADNMNTEGWNWILVTVLTLLLALVVFYTPFAWRLQSQTILNKSK